MNIPSESESAKIQKNEIVGRTWADMISKLPLWIIAAALSFFASVFAFSIATGNPVTLGVIGNFGTTSSVSTLDNIAKLKHDLLLWENDPAVPGNAVGGGDPRPATMCPPGHYAAGINWWGAPRAKQFCIGCLEGIQVVCRKLNTN